MSEHECCHEIIDGWSLCGRKSCGRKGKVCVDGKWYCGIHDPIKNAEKLKAINERLGAEWKESQRVASLNREAPAMLDMLKRIMRCVVILPTDFEDEIRALIQRAEGGENEKSQ